LYVIDLLTKEDDRAPILVTLFNNQSDKQEDTNSSKCGPFNSRVFVNHCRQKPKLPGRGKKRKNGPRGKREKIRKGEGE